MSRLALASRRLNLEPLEDRTLMSTCHVTRLTDQGVGKGFRGDLRYCINKVNAEPGPDAIDFTVTGTIDLQNVLPTVSDDIVIDGPGASSLVVDANLVGRVLSIEAGINAQIYRITITGGRAITGGGINNAGMLTLADAVIDGNDGYHGSGIFNTGTLLVYGSAITNNQSTYSSGRGGGINNDHGVTAVYNSTIANNGVETYGGGIFVDGGMAIVEFSTIAGNMSNSHGGGIFNSGGGVSTLNHVTLTGNFADRWGGAIYDSGNLTVETCTISANSAGESGGGVYTHWNGQTFLLNSTVTNNLAPDGGGAYVYGNLTGTNSTISGNTASDRGGGIYNRHSITLGNSTVSENSAVNAGGGIYSSDNPPGMTLNIHNTIVAGNTAPLALGPDVKGTLTLSGYNLFGNGSWLFGTTSTDMVDVDPMLGPLADNGGPTLTHALLSGSPAIDAGDNTDAPEFDQRGPGFPRIVNGTIDIGAFEVQATGAPVPTDNLGVLVTAELGDATFQKRTRRGR